MASPSRALSRSQIVSVSALLLLSVSAGRGFAQDVSVARTPFASDQTVRLENMATHERYDRSGDSYFIVPAGRYSVQLLRGGAIVYQETEYIGADSPSSRSVAPGGSAVVGLPEGNPRFDSSPCSALETATRLAIGRFGLHGTEVERRLTHADAQPWAGCATNEGVDALAATLAGAYGVTPLGTLGLSIDYIPLSRQPRRPRPSGSGNDLGRPSPSGPAQSSAAQASGAQVSWSSVVDDLKNGFSDVLVDATGRAMLVCAALNSVTPLFCQFDGAVAGAPAMLRLLSLYRFHGKTSPVDSRGVEDDHWVTFATEDEYHATQQRLTSDLQLIQAGLLQGIAQVDAKSFIAAGKSGQSARYYPAVDFTALIETTQAQIEAALRDTTLQPLRRHFPQPIASVKVAGASVPEADARAAFRQLQDAVAVLSNAAGGLGFDLVFKTHPVESEGTRLTFSVCDRCIPIVSQGGEHRFYRGRYHILASLDGYLPYDGWLDLIDDPRTVLECDMERLNRGNGRTSTCSQRAQ